MSNEISALEDNNTWEYAVLPPGKKAIGSKWVYKIKYHANRSIERYKAHHIVLGNTQVEGEDFHEAFVPIAKMTIVEHLLSIAVTKGWKLHQMDVHNTFLHGDFHEDIYMKPPPSCHPPRPNLVCKLRKVIIWTPSST